jgi:TPR repeat protein
VAADRKQLEQLASKGSVEAMKLIGVIHARAGENDLAVPWYEKAISLGNLDALSNLGVLRFGERKFEVGIDLLAAAANRGSNMAMRNLAICFARLKYEQASLAWHSRAAIFGDAKSAMSAAELYLGQNQRDKATEMLRIAESLGVTEATAKLAEMGN